MKSGAATRDDIIQCYRSILKRDPESEAVVQLHLLSAPTIWDIVERFIHSNEFRKSIVNNDLFAERKFAQSEYFAKSISGKSSCDFYYHHHSFLCDALDATAYETLLHDGVVLFARQPGEVEYKIVLHASREYQNEGELSLTFQAKTETLYTFSFTIVPGWIVGLPDPSIPLVSRMQGRPGRFGDIRLATREIMNISPQALLFAALQGIARALGLERIAGVCGANHVGFDVKNAHMFAQAYDDFFASVGAQGPVGGFYVASALPARGASWFVKPGHRLRTRAKRKFKAEVADAARAAWPVDGGRAGRHTNGDTPVMTAADTPAPHRAKRTPALALQRLLKGRVAT
jgi:uncharacterized protein VirK/YbjX